MADLTYADNRSTTKVQLVLQEGYSDQLGGNHANLSREYRFARLPVIGEAIDTGYGDSDVKYVWWGLDGEATLRLQETYSLSEPFDYALDKLIRSGWRKY